MAASEESHGKSSLIISDLCLGTGGGARAMHRSLAELTRQTLSMRLMEWPEFWNRLLERRELGTT